MTILIAAALIAAGCSTFYPGIDSTDPDEATATTSQLPPLDGEPDIEMDCDTVHVHARLGDNGVILDFHGFGAGAISQTPEGWFLADCVAREVQHALADISAHDIDARTDEEVTVAEGNLGIVVTGLPEIMPIVGVSYPVAIPDSAALTLGLLLDAHFHVPPPDDESAHGHSHDHAIFHLPDDADGHHAHPHTHDDERPFDHDHS